MELSWSLELFAPYNKLLTAHVMFSINNCGILPLDYVSAEHIYFALVHVIMETSLSHKLIFLLTHIRLET